VTPAELLDLSDERDLHLRLRLAAWREGFAAGRASMADEVDLAYVDGLLRRKRIEHDQVRALTGGTDRVDVWADQQRRMWAPPGLARSPWPGAEARAHFADARPGDFPGRRRHA